MIATMTCHNHSIKMRAQVQSAPLLAPSLNACALVVEDHEDTRFLLRTILEMRGISVVEAVDGEMAIALAENMRLDLIIMDTNLPLLDGYEATRRIRQLTFTRDVPVVIISGHAQAAAQAKAFAAGCNDYLVKPFAMDELGSVLEKHLLRDH